MKNNLLASMACIGIVSGVVGTAQAALPVTDTASIVAQAREAAQQLGEMVTQYDMMKQQYGQLVSTYNVLSHPNEILNIGRGLMQQQMREPGSTPSNIPGLAFGSQLSARGSQFLSQNRYYNPTGSDYAASEMRRQAQATANLQAEAQEGMERADERISSLNELQQSIQDQPDITSLTAVHARIGSEQLFMQNEANSVARLQMIQATAARVDQQRAEQAGRKDAEDWATHAGTAFNGSWQGN